MIKKRVGLTRRSALAGGVMIAGLGAGALLTRPADFAELPAAFKGESLFADVIRYDAFGVHRTGSAPDLETAEWMADHLRRYGFVAEKVPFSLPFFTEEVCEIVAAGKSLPAAPQWPVPPSGLAIETLLGRLNDEKPLRGRIALLTFPYNRRARIDLPEYSEQLNEARDRGAVAAICVTEGPTGEIIHLNAPRPGTDLPLPTVLTAAADRSELDSALAKGIPVTLTLQGLNTPEAKAYNVIGVRDVGGPPIVVSTPISAWTHAAGERGPGIALWRALAQWAVNQRRQSFIFIATSGHEFDHHGFYELLPRAKEAIGDAGVKAWLHLGANLAVRDFAHDGSDITLLNRVYDKRWLVGSPQLLPAMSWSFAKVPGLFPLPALEGQIAGEIGSIMKADFSPVAGIFGSAPMHHVASDRPHTTSPALLEALAQPVLRTFADWSAS